MNQDKFTSNSQRLIHIERLALADRVIEARYAIYEWVKTDVFAKSDFMEAMAVCDVAERIVKG